MNGERRKHQRLVKPFEGTWSGASGATRCRIADISLGGCFIQSLALPTAGEQVVVTVTIGNHALSFPGTIMYTEAGMGFAVQFHDIPQVEIEELGRLLQALAGPTSA